MTERPTEINGATEAAAHPAVRAWAELCPGRPEPTRVTTLKAQEEKSAVYRLEGAGEAGAAVVAKRCRAAVAAVERLVYERVLPRLPPPQLRCYGWVPEPDRRCAWLFVEDAGEGAFCPALPEHRRLAARWLAQVHAAARESAEGVELPDRGPGTYLGEARSVREAIRASHGNPVFTAADRDVLEVIDGQLAFVEAHRNEVEAVCEAIPPTLVHGDFVAKNIRLRAAPEGTQLFALDWETAGWGVPAADLCRFAGAPAMPDLDTYCSVLREAGQPVALKRVDELAHLGGVFRLISAMLWASLRLGDPWVNKCMRWMRCYRAEMVPALRATRWGQAVPA
jgi:hypothetical protein